MYTLYDVSMDSIWQTQPSMQLIVSVIIVFVFFAVILPDKKYCTKKEFVSRVLIVICFFFVFFSRTVTQLIDFYDNPFVNEYLKGNYKTITGQVYFGDLIDENEQTLGRINGFYIDDKLIEYYNREVTTRGYSYESGGNTLFKEGDVLQISYIDNIQTNINSYPEVVIMHIDLVGTQGDGSSVYLDEK